MLGQATGLSLEELSDLQVLFYIGRNRDYGEHSEADHERTITEDCGGKSLREPVHHLMSKTNLFEAAVDGAEPSDVRASQKSSAR